MKLREVNITRYRSIENMRLSFADALGHIQPVTVLAGPNGCGKTSVLFGIVQALRGLMGYRTDDVPEPSDLDIHRGESGDSLMLTPPRIRVDLEVCFGADELAAIREVTNQMRDRRPDWKEPPLPGFSGPAARVTWSYPPSSDRKGGPKPTWHVEKVSPNEAFRWFKGRLWAIQATRDGLLNDAALIGRIGGPLMFPQDRSLKARVTGTGGQKSEPDVELSVWEILKELGQRANAPALEGDVTRQTLEDAKASENRIKERFAQICAPKEYVGFAYTPNDPKGSPYFREGRSHYPLSLASSGEQVILEYIARLSFPSVLNHGLILIDEPEVHLHPGWIRQLYRALPALGEDNQFILTTHSPELRAMAAADGILIELGDLQRD